MSASYLQWCDDNHLFQRQSRVELQEMLATMYRPMQPRGVHPIGEVEALPPGFDRGGQPDSSQLTLAELTLTEPLAAEDGEKTADVEYSGIEAAAVIRKHRPRGFKTGDLDEARDRFLAIVGQIPVAWRAG